MSNATLNVGSATGAELLSFYNAHSGIATVKRFADRRSAEKRVAALLAERQFNVPAPLPEVSGADASYIKDYGVAHCPSCLGHLSNGVGHDGQEVNGRFIRHARFQFACLGCGEEFGPLVVRYTTVRNGKPIIPRPAMTETLKLERRIVSLASGIVYKNANQVYKAGLVSSSQCDRLSALLYGAAKRGDRTLQVVINGNAFHLAA